MSDWTEKEKRDKRRKRLRLFAAPRRVQAMTPKSSFRVIVQPIASSLTPVGRTGNSSAFHSQKKKKLPETWGPSEKPGKEIVCGSLKTLEVEKVSLEPPAQQHDIQCHLVKCVTLSHM